MVKQASHIGQPTLGLLRSIGKNNTEDFRGKKSHSLYFLKKLKKVKLCLKIQIYKKSKIFMKKIKKCLL